MSNEINTIDNDFQVLKSDIMDAVSGRTTTTQFAVEQMLEGIEANISAILALLDNNPQLKNNTHITL